MSSMKRIEENFKAFVKESLAIEGIFREPTKEELDATWEFVNLDKVKVADLCYLVYVYQPNAIIRANASDQVWIGGKEAPKGGLSLLTHLGQLLYDSYIINDPQLIHCEYEYLHPFTDGNGRSGRALWANLMLKQGYKFEYGFLQMFYYQTLSKYTAGREELT